MFGPGCEYFPTVLMHDFTALGNMVHLMVRKRQEDRKQ